MAEQDYRRLSPACFCGVPLKVFARSGRPAKFCSAGHRTSDTWKLGRTCARCGLAFEPAGSHHVYCSRDCSDKTKRPPIPLLDLKCGYCAKRFTQKSSAMRYCGKACKVAACLAKQGKRPSFEDRVERAERREDERLQREAALLRRREQYARDSAIQSVARSIRRVALRRAALARREESARLRGALRCVQCDQPFLGKSIHARYCGEACAFAHRKQSESYRAEKRAWRVARRARERAASIEKFDPEEVLARDGWRCQICGVDTPKRLRGTYKPNAPELDHIVALSRGGAHSRANTQCACRRCNGIKSNGRPMGQIALAFT